MLNNKQKSGKVREEIKKGIRNGMERKGDKEWSSKLKKKKKKVCMQVRNVKGPAHEIDVSIQIQQNLFIMITIMIIIISEGAVMAASPAASRRFEKKSPQQHRRVFVNIKGGRVFQERRRAIISTPFFAPSYFFRFSKF